jgi:hypothetical protein
MNIHTNHQRVAAQMKRIWESKFAYQPSVKEGVLDISIPTSHGPLIVRLAALPLDEKTGRPIVEKNTVAMIVHETVILPGGTVVPCRSAESERVVDVRLSKSGEVFVLYRDGHVKRYDAAWDALKSVPRNLIQAEGPFSYNQLPVPIGGCVGDYYTLFAHYTREDDYTDHLGNLARYSPSSNFCGLLHFNPETGQFTQYACKRLKDTTSLGSARTHESAIEVPLHFSEARDALVTFDTSTSTFKVTPIVRVAAGQ